MIQKVIQTNQLYNDHNQRHHDPINYKEEEKYNAEDDTETNKEEEWKKKTKKTDNSTTNIQATQCR